MFTRRASALLALLMVVSLVLGACTPAQPGGGSGTPFTIGVILVGPKNDHGWSEAHFNATEYAKSKIPGLQVIVEEKLNPADRPNVKLEQLVEDMISRGAKMIFTTSDDFKADTLESAKKHPDITFMHISGDSVLAGTAPANLGNYMGSYGSSMTAIGLVIGSLAIAEVILKTPFDWPVTLCCCPQIRLPLVGESHSLN